MTTWTPVSQQTETWTSEAPTQRVFDPFVFDRAPVFDTGKAAGIWQDSTIQSETWIVEP